MVVGCERYVNIECGQSQGVGEHDYSEGASHEVRYVWRVQQVANAVAKVVGSVPGTRKWPCGV